MPSSAYAGCGGNGSNAMFRMSGSSRWPRPKPARVLAAAVGEASGALGDLGAFLPFVVAVLVAGTLTPEPVLAGFAAGYLTVALVYRIPISVQPMKVLGAAIVTGGLTALEIAWAGMALGAVLLLLAATPLLDRAARAVPQSVVTGLQVGLGLTLGAMAFELMRHDWLLAAAAAAVLALTFVRARGPWVLLVVGCAAAAGPSLGIQPALPAASESSLPHALLAGALPQLPLTLVNAVVVAAAVGRSLYGARADRVSERRLAASTGFLNLALAPLGALPMCYGAGGIAAHHRFGGRGMGAPLAMAGLCAAAALAGQETVALLSRIPAPVIGALLLYAAADLAFSRRLLDARADCRPVIGAAAAATLLWGAAAGLAAGLAAEAVRARLLRRRTAADA